MNDLERALRRVDEYWMRFAIDVARGSAELGEWPFGAAVVLPSRQSRYGDCVGGPLSSTERTSADPTGHAEVNAMRQAFSRSQTFAGDLREATLYTTHEPCLMCAGMAAQLRIGRVVVGTMRQDLPDHFRQRSLSFEAILHDARYPVEVVTGVLRDQALALFERVGVGT